MTMSRHDRRAARSRGKGAGCPPPRLFVLPAQTKAEAEADHGAARADDVVYFECFPDRSHRVRPAVLAEMREVMARGGPTMLPKRGKWATIVHQVRPGLHLQQVAIVPRDTPDDIGEVRARELWERHDLARREAVHVVADVLRFGL